MLVQYSGKKQWLTASWPEKNQVKMIDQRLLPEKFKVITLKSHFETAKAIENMTTRGAGSIGAAAAFACAQAVLECKESNFPSYSKKAFNRIKKTRPTAFDLFNSVQRMENAIKGKNLKEAKKFAVKESQKISGEYVERGKKIGLLGEKLLKNNSKMLTHCNAGWLALHDWGSALAPVYAANRKKKKVFVFVDETRPRLQGAKLTAWELLNERIPHKIIADNAAGYFMQRKEIDLCIVGSDRIALNGDVANKIGTYEKALLAKENNIPFFVAAPTSTIDLNSKSGKSIPIEERSEKEVLFINNERIAPKNSSALNPAFDVTPAKLIKGIITEKGIIKPNSKSIRGLFK